MQDDFFPHRAAITIREVMHFVHNHVQQTGQRIRAGVDHVAKDFGRHDHDRGITIDREIAGEQSDAFLTIFGDEVAVFLVRQRLDRCRVKAFAVLLECEVDREFADDGLTRSGWRSNKHSPASFECFASTNLEIVEIERAMLAEFVQAGLACCGAGFRRCVAFGWCRHGAPMISTASGPTDNCTGVGPRYSPSAQAV